MCLTRLGILEGKEGEPSKATKGDFLGERQGKYKAKRKPVRTLLDFRVENTTAGDMNGGGT